MATVVALDPPPDVVLCTGDLVNDGTDEQYAHLRRLLEPIEAPIRLVCGNHDDRAALRDPFGEIRTIAFHLLELLGRRPVTAVILMRDDSARLVELVNARHPLAHRRPAS